MKDFKIHLRIADVDFYVKIEKDEDEEELYRNAAKRINRLMEAYRQSFKDTDNESELTIKKLLAMTALHLAKSEAEKKTDDNPCLKVVESLNKELEEFLG